MNGWIAVLKRGTERKNFSYKNAYLISIYNLLG
jgi:hypothetical protein